MTLIAALLWDWFPFLFAINTIKSVHRTEIIIYRDFPTALDTNNTIERKIGKHLVGNFYMKTRKLRFFSDRKS